MRLKTPMIWFVEALESCRMAFTAIAAHKLRSALTLLGVMVGVFSIIVVMTAMRVMQSNIERQLSSLGSETFEVLKWPGTFIGVSSGDYEKYWRRKNVTLSDGKRLQEKMTLPANIGIEATFWSGEIDTRYKTSAPTVRLFGETPGSFPARNWNLAEGRLLVPVRHGQDYYDKPPLLYWLVMGIYQLFGVHDWAARLVPCGAAFLCVLATYAWGKRAVGARAAFAGALMLCLSPRFAQMARMLTTFL